MLPDEIRQRIEGEAKRRGIDPAEAIAEAERISKSKAPPSEKSSEQPKETPGDKSGDAGRPIADRLLIGFLPFIKVRELREYWLGLTERIPDDEMTCGEFQMRHGGAGQSTVAASEPE